MRRRASVVRLMSPDLLVSRVNETAPSAFAERGRWTHTGTYPFASSHVSAFTLGNGLRVLVHVDTSAPIVSYFTWYRVGSRHEKQGKTGLAHLFEHLMFNEAEGHAAGEFDKKLEEAGAESNAATWFDWTYYYESLPKDSWDLAVRLESERMQKLVLKEPQIESEKEVVANERRMRVDDDIEGAAGELLYKTAFSRHVYGTPTIGWMEDIVAFTPADCAAFYKTYYAPNNATVVVCGDIGVEEVLTKIRDAYGAYEASTLPAEDILPEPAQREERRVRIEEATPSEKVLVGYHGPALGDADHPAMSILCEILFGGRACRVSRSMCVEREIATDVRGWVGTFRDPGLFEAYLTARPGVNGAALLEAFEHEITRMQTDLVAPEELARAKARLEYGLVASLETAAGKAEQIGFYDTVLGDPVGAFRRLEAYERVDAARLRYVARKYLVTEARTIVHVVPEPEDADGAASSAAGAEAS